MRSGGGLDIGGSFAEFHPIDFNEGFVLVGHRARTLQKIAGVLGVESALVGGRP
ncbi:MAG: hypothetical protein ABSG86_05410 [Thermoguttaceae bacterium]